jgi:hypothetical protein
MEYTGSDVRHCERANGRQLPLKGQINLQAKRSVEKMIISVNNQLQNYEQEMQTGKAGWYMISGGVFRHLEGLPLVYKVKLGPTKAHGRVEE